ncbi:MAG: hypothetical protein HOM55_08675 [Proteobacteria bacterium]|jgi:hypothetical protein|nr:hypothetical protein [Pseudomonadota bacterium]
MKILNIIIGSVFLLSVTASAQEWREFVDQEQYFAINFPGPPEVLEIDYPSEYGVVLPAKTYTYKNDEADYSLTVVDYNEGERLYKELPDRTDEGNNSALYLYDQRAATAFAAHNIRKRGGEITFDAWNHIDMVEGHQLQITHSDGSRTYAGIYLHEGRLYIVEAIVPKGGLPQGLFQQSLSFLDDESLRIRYQLHADGTKVRVPRPEEQPRESAY